MSPMAGRRLVRVSGIIEKLKSGFAAAPPTDTITFLFSDIEGSVRLWEQHPSEMGRILARHDLLIHQAVEAHGGHTFKTVGDAFCVVFRTADNALNAALAAQRAMNGEDWGPIGSLSVRFALHTGVAEQRDGDYFGRSVNRVARLVSAAHGGQTLLSLTTEELVRENLPQDASLRDLGEHRPQGLSHPERVFELLVPDLPVHSPPILSSAVDSRSTPLRETEPISPSKSSTAPEPLSVEVEPEKEIGPIDEMVLWAGPPVVFPDAGAELVLTIDRNIQVMVEEELARSVAEYQAEGGTVIVMDPPRTFGILAMARLPDYDPGRYDDSFDRSAPPFEDPAISRQYEPGSVFKIATVAAALDSGVATPETTYYDGGEIEVGGRVTMNTSRRAYSEQTVTDVLVKPLNVGTAWLSTQMGPNAFYRYVWDFGFGRLTEVGLAGEVPGQVWLPGDIEYWHDSNLGTNSFGQGLAVTPLQMVTAIAAVAKDGIHEHEYRVAALTEAFMALEETMKGNGHLLPVRQVSHSQAAKLANIVSVRRIEGSREAVLGRRVIGDSGCPPPSKDVWVCDPSARACTGVGAFHDRVGAACDCHLIYRRDGFYRDTAGSLFDDNSSATANNMETLGAAGEEGPLSVYEGGLSRMMENSQHHHSSRFLG